VRNNHSSTYPQTVIPAKAGIQAVILILNFMLTDWIPAFAGMTTRKVALPLLITLLSQSLQAADLSDQASPSTSSTRTLTLDQAMDLALQQNTDVLLSKLSLLQFDSRYWETVGLALPQISFTGTYTKNQRKPVIFFQGETIAIARDHSLDATVSAEQALFTGGKVGTAVRAAKKGREAAEAADEGTREEILLGVKRLFYRGLLAYELVDIEKDNLASVEDHLRTIKERYQQGVDSDLTVRRQEVEVANARVNLIRIRNEMDVTFMSLQDILALDVNKPLQLEGKLMPPANELPNYTLYAEKALQNRPELVAARKQTAVARDLITIARGDLLPQLGLFGAYSWQAQYDNYPPQQNERANILTAGLMLRQNIFTGGQHWQHVKQAKIFYESAQQEEARKQRQVQIEVKREWLSVKEALERSLAMEDALDQARLTLKATEARYKEGQSDLLELNDATLALNVIRIRTSLASNDYWTSRAALDRAAGIPLKENTP